MRVATAFVCVCVMAGSVSAAAQAPAGGSVSGALKQNWAGAKKNITESATMMDEAGYAFKPVDSVRTFGQILAHVAGASYVICAAAKGEKAPYDEGHFEKTATGKAAIVKAVNESMTYCDGAYDALTDAKGSESITLPFGMGTGPRSSPLILNYGHLLEHYGNLVTYFRMKGMVPPSSAPRK